MSQFALYLGCIGALQLVSRYLFISIFNRVAERQMYRLRKIYLRALLRQNVGWYDTVEDRNFISKISEMVNKVQEATGEKVGLCVFYSCNCLVNVSFAFWYGWLLTLVVFSSTPVIAVASVVMSTFQTKFAVREQRQTTLSGKVSEEALTNIRTVMAFSGQEKEMARYEKGLVHAVSAGKSRGLVTALGNGVLWLLNYSTYALAFWFGSKLIFDGQRTACEKTPEYGAGELLIVFFCVVGCSFNAGRVLSNLDVFSVGRAAAATIYTVIDRTPEIDSYSDTGKNPSSRPLGKIHFRNVGFSYPSRKDVQILRGLTLTVTPGSTVALVGNSGCGKSTTLQLLQRFYDPDSGTVLLDDTDIRDFNISWLRSQLGVVSQEPILFDTTIAENIRYGRDGVGQKEIEDACHLSNAHAFISKLPHKYDTLVGQRGAQLSGGQKQRIAIARALVRNPSILLLDEATSALDTQSESIVQQALDKARKGRTTLIVAHRLSTIRNADLIVSIQDGQVAEIGTHSELLAKNGLYYQLVTTQMGEEVGGDNIVGYSTEVSNTFTDSTDPAGLSISAPEDQLLTVNPGTSNDEDLSDKLIVDNNTILRLLKLNMKEWPYILLGLIMSISHGCVLPMYAFYYGDFMDILSYNDYDKGQDEANRYAIIFVIIGVFAAITFFASSACFSFAGEALTNRLRQMVFKKMLYQDVAWFDNPKNSVGALCIRLAGDTATVQGATGSRLGTVVQCFTTLALAGGISLYVLPKAGAVALAFVPLIVIASYYNGVLTENQHVEEKDAFEKASNLAFQAVSNIRTVASLCKEKSFVEMYAKELLSPHKKALKHSHLKGIVHGLSESSLYCSYAAVFYYGAYLITNENAEYKSILIIGEALVYSMLVLGETLAFAPNYNKAKVSGARILKLLDAKPLMDLSPGTGLQIRSSQGSVIFDKTEFSYPTRPEMKILKGLTFGVEPNLNLGICGPSGSGKSTCIQLILRYYDPTSGRVLFDETDVSSMNLIALRSQIAIVAQEPALFDRTIAENIAYGDNSRELHMTEIISAAKSANIHNFIASLPSGYDTRVGDMGAQLSGGQKQRVAISRALVRNPKLLLLDEATSALDMESEKVVQEALDIASAGRTCITIAHRLSSIQNADKILVINNGVLSESGTHAELLSQRGIYFKLWNMQSHGHN